MRHDREHHHLTEGRPRNATFWAILSVAAIAGVTGIAAYQSRTRNRVGRRLPDSAPGRTARQRRFGEYAVVGRSVTINRPRDELYAFWRDFSNLPKFMENVRDVTVTGDLTRWSIAGPADREVRVEARIVDDRPNEQIAWRSTEGSDIDTEGKVVFRDAPAGRGTEIEAIVSYVPPAGELGRWVATMFQAEPALQGRRELRRFKMLMETGEIATNHNRKAA